MADENKKSVAKADTSEASKAKKEKKASKFSPKNIGKGIAHFFKDLRGETKKIVWPGRQMVIKSTGIVLAVILVIGAGIWLLDFALSGAVTAFNKAADNFEVTEVADETTEADDSVEIGEEKEETEKSEESEAAE